MRRENDRGHRKKINGEGNATKPIYVRRRFWAWNGDGERMKLTLQINNICRCPQYAHKNPRLPRCLRTLQAEREHRSGRANVDVQNGTGTV